MYKMQFEADGEYNKLYLFRESDDFPLLEAKIRVPAGASDDYGYLTMKRAILEMKSLLPEHIHNNLVFPYDGQEQYLHADASAAAPFNITLG